VESPVDREGQIRKAKDSGQYVGLDPKPTHDGDNGSRTSPKTGLPEGSKGKDFKGR
jgi:hypothetical protein